MSQEEKNTSSTVVGSVSRYKKYRLKTKKSSLNEDNLSTEELLSLYHSSNTPKDAKKMLREAILLKVYFLFPYYVRRKYSLSTDMFNDAMQNFTVSTLQAMEMFKPELGFRFSSFLCGYFKEATAKTFSDSNVVTVPSARRVVIEHIYDQDEGSDDENASEQEDEVQDRIANAIGNMRRAVPFTGGENVSPYDALESADKMDEDVHNSQLREWLVEAFTSNGAGLTSSEREVLLLHYGLNGNHVMKHRQIAEMRRKEGLGSALSRISQLHTSAVHKLRVWFQANGLEEY